MILLVTQCDAKTCNESQEWEVYDLTTYNLPNMLQMRGWFIYKWGVYCGNHLKGLYD